MNNSDFIEYQIFLTTADIESTYIVGYQPTPAVSIEPSLPSGTYRVVDGQLYRIVASPKSTPIIEVKDLYN